MALRRSRRNAADAPAIRGGVPSQGHGGGTLPRRVPAVGVSARRRIPESQGNGGDSAPEGSQYALRSGNDHTPSAEGSGINRKGFGKFRRLTKPAAWPPPSLRPS